jgi:hypothetical protein
MDKIQNDVRFGLARGALLYCVGLPDKVRSGAGRCLDAPTGVLGRLPTPDLDYLVLTVKVVMLPARDGLTIKAIRAKRLRNCSDRNLREARVSDVT